MYGFAANVEGMTNWDAAFGAIALAAYKPDSSAFCRQLRSIQEQTHANFHCVISVDGGAADVQGILDRELAGDSRFQVLGFETRLGFYRNFERALLHIPSQAKWVALSDQDDFWYPNKLAALLPHLESKSLVSGQARVVASPSGLILSEATQRKTVGLRDLVLRNQITGAMSVFRRDLLDIALPFPEHETLELHDHWLGVCAAASEGFLVRDEILQDYMQHANNALGEALGKYSISGYIRRISRLASIHRCKRSLPAFLRTANDLTFGWSGAMLDTLLVRLSSPSEEVRSVVAAFGSHHSWRSTLEACLGAAKSGTIGKAFLVEFAAGLPCEVFRWHGKRRISERKDEQRH